MTTARTSMSYEGYTAAEIQALTGKRAGDVYIASDTNVSYIINADGLPQAATDRSYRTIFVDPNGKDENSGRAVSSAKKTVQAGITAGGNSHMVLVASGIYSDGFNFDDDNITLKAQSYGSAVAQVVRYQGAVTATASGCKIMGGRFDGGLTMNSTGSIGSHLAGAAINSAASFGGTYFADYRDNQFYAAFTPSFGGSATHYVRSCVFEGGLNKSGSGIITLENCSSASISITGGTFFANNLQGVGTATANPTINIGAGVVYHLQQVQGFNLVIDPAAVKAKDAYIAAGASEEVAENKISSRFERIKTQHGTYIETTSLTPKYHNGTGLVDARADSMNTLADVLQTSSGETISAGSVLWPSHGLNIGAHYWLDSSTAGAITDVEPLSGFIQPLLFVSDENSVEVLVMPYIGDNTIATGVVTDPNPTANLTNAVEGNVAFDTTDKKLRVYNSGSWQPYAQESVVLTKTNVATYTPTSDYHPATKAYVDNLASPYRARVVSDGSFGSTYAGTSWTKVLGMTHVVPEDGDYEVTLQATYAAGTGALGCHVGIGLDSAASFQSGNTRMVTNVSSSGVGIFSNFYVKAVLTGLSAGDTIRPWVYRSGSANFVIYDSPSDNRMMSMDVVKVGV